ncbi:MAG: maleylpyruvate isomerase family mycothiol-dependent enzyme [Chloroflexota bacterium]
MADTARAREALRLHAREGEAFAADLEALSEKEWETPSTCPPWTIRLLAAHVARQVDSYINSVEQGLRGEVGVMEPRDQRARIMAEIAARPSAGIVEYIRTTNARFNEWFGHLMPEQLDVNGTHSHGPRPASWWIEMRLAEMAFHRQDLELSLGRSSDLDQETARFLLPMLLEKNVPAIVARDKTGGEGTYALAVRGEPGAVWRLAFRAGGLDVSPGDANADTTFEADSAGIARMMYGRVTWPELAQQGRLSMTGSATAAERFHTLFKGP